MPCHAAMSEKLITVSPDQEVTEALELMRKEGVETVPVIDEERNLLGLFSIQILFKNLLPVSVAMSDGVQLDVTVRAAPGIAKRLKKVEPLKVSDLMEKDIRVVNPETPLWEGVNILVQHGGPLLVIDSESGNLAGIIDGSSALDELQRLKDSEA